jgi:leader peptidase (prepilin peptidase)/N-methyltransferase
MTWYLDTGAAMAAAGLVSGPLVPALIARIPEPLSEEQEVDEADASTPEHLADGLVASLQQVEPPDTVAEEPKELYTSIAAHPGLAWKAGVAAALSGGLVGASVGWAWELLFLMYLVPVGVALAVVDWRTRLLPTKVIAPSYAVVAALAVLAAALSGDWSDLVRAGWGWVVAGGTFLLLWLVYPRGMGYGDVRLSGVLGIALGFLGWWPLLVGVYAGFLLGGLGGALLTVLRVVDRKAYPFGPFMLLGALVGIVTGEWVGDLYLGRP